MQPVIEVPMLSDGPAPRWPVAEMPEWSWLVLNGDCIDDQVGLFVSALSDQIDAASPGGRDEVVDAPLAEESLIIAGGLHVDDCDAGAVVVPGCCAGLEDWRDWALC